jgi:hypothetical protein
MTRKEDKTVKKFILVAVAVAVFVLAVATIENLPLITLVCAVAEFFIIKHINK